MDSFRSDTWFGRPDNHTSTLSRNTHTPWLNSPPKTTILLTVAAALATAARDRLTYSDVSSAALVGLGVGTLEHAFVTVGDRLIDALTILAIGSERVHDLAQPSPVGHLR